MVEHTTVFREAGRFAGWPANYGIWPWDDEIVVGFTVGYCSGDGSSFHARDKSKPFLPMQARSRDGGKTWQVRRTPCRTPGDRGLSADEHMQPGLRVGEVLDEPNALEQFRGGIDFTHLDFALMCARSGLGAGARSWFYISVDRCNTWQGPFVLPTFGQLGIDARTDYLVSDSQTCTLFLTAAKSNGREGRVFCARTSDGGKKFELVSWIGPEPKGHAIMPASVRLSDSRLLVAVRCADRSKPSGWVDLYASDDNGATWRFLNCPVPRTGRGGNPPTLTKLTDGRLCMVYGYRDPPYGIRARLSQDQGRSWGDEVVLRSDAGNHDIGYPRTVQRSDGKLVTVYYYNDHPDGERYIAATIWGSSHES